MTNRVVVCISVLLMFLDMIWFVFRLKKRGVNSERKGNKSFWIKEISIYSCAILLIAIIWIIEFGMIGNIILCGCSVLSVEMANKEILA